MTLLFDYLEKSSVSTTEYLPYNATSHALVLGSQLRLMTNSTYPGLQNSQNTQQYSDSVFLLFFSSRSDINRLKETKAQKRMKEDHTRTLNDWQRMNLTELKVLPEQSRYQVKKAIMSYLGTSKGSNRALKPLLSELSTAE